MNKEDLKNRRDADIEEAKSRKKYTDARDAAAKDREFKHKAKMEYFKNNPKQSNTKHAESLKYAANKLAESKKTNKTKNLASGPKTEKESKKKIKDFVTKS